MTCCVPPCVQCDCETDRQGESDGEQETDICEKSHTSDFKIGTPVATLPGTWCCSVSAGTSWPGVSIL